MLEESRRSRVEIPVKPPRRRSSGTMPVIWIPWLVAPFFALMPIGGCALANNYRKAAAAATVPAVVPVAAVVTGSWH